MPLPVWLSVLACLLAQPAALSASLWDGTIAGVEFQPLLRN
jgi:hypothetical protein